MSPQNKPVAQTEAPVIPIDADKLTTAAIVDVIQQGGKIRLVEDDESNARQRAVIRARKMAATTAEQLLAPAELLTSKKARAEVVDKPLKLVAVGVRNQDEAYAEDGGGIGIYVTLHVENRAQPIGVGAEDIVLTALRLVEIDALPQWVMIKSDRTKSGYEVFNLVGCAPPVGEEEPF